MEGNRAKKRKKSLSKEAKILLALVLVVAGVVLVFGRVTYYNELGRGVREHVFLGYMDENAYSGPITVTGKDLPALYRETLLEGVVENDKVYTVVCDAAHPRLGVYGDVSYLDNRTEERRWIDGKLIWRREEYYYKLREHVTVEACANGLRPEIAEKELRPLSYGPPRKED